MAKLLFETEDGETQEIKVSTIKTKGITSDDVVIAHYEIGELPEERKHLAGPELLKLKELLTDAFPENTKILVAAMRNGKEDISIKIAKDKTKD